MTIRDLLATLRDAFGALLNASLLDIFVSALGVGALIVILWLSIFGEELRRAREARKKRDASR